MAAAGTSTTSVAQATMCATLVDQWVRDGASIAVVAPGSRSTPMALALAARPDLRVEVFHDERSAAFAALGVGLGSGTPAIALCTSGTAATHFHAAVVEADLADVPMIMVTADRPPELHAVGAPQTIDQTRLFGPSVRWFHDPGVADAAAAHTWRSLARQAWRAATVTAGPVHLNLPFREPLLAEAADLPDAFLGALPPASSAVVALGTLALELERERGLIIAGRGIDDPAAVFALAAATGWPLIADPRSGCRGEGAIAHVDGILRHDEFAASHRPDVVVHLGEPPASKVLGQFLADAGGTQVRVSGGRRTLDPHRTITHHVTASVGAVCRRLAVEVSGARETDWGARWQAAEQRVAAAFSALLDRDELDEPTVARLASRFAGEVVVASSMPIRDIEWFGPAPQRARVHANRGANGIDGTVATAIGVALGTGAPTMVLLGDVALLHDQSSLTALSRRGVDVRIVVLDNDGGGIFSFLPQAAAIPAERFELLFGTPHGTDLNALAAAHRLPCAEVASSADLEGWLRRPGPSLARVSSDRAGNVAVHARLQAAAVAAVGDR